MPGDDVEQIIEDLLDATQKPFDNRLEVVCYLFFADSMHMSQEKAQAAAKEMAAWLMTYMRVDVDSK